MIYLSESVYRDKVMGCWLGKNAGGILGGPLERIWGNPEPFNISFYTQEIPEGGCPNDDLEIQLVWLKALEERGLGLTYRDLAEYWLNHVYNNPDEYGFHKMNLRLGLLPPESGWYNNPFKHNMGCPIRSEIWARIAPGIPDVAVAYAWEDAVCDHAGGESVFGEIFNAALQSAAFVISDRDRLLDIGFSVIPEDSLTALSIWTAREAHGQGASWREARDRDMKCVFNLNDHYSPINLGYQTVGWLYGEVFGDALCKAVNCGWDTDCTAATLSATFGIIHGTSGLPDKWIAPMGREIAVTPAPGIDYFDPPKDIDDLTDRTIAIGRQFIAKYPERVRLDEKEETHSASSVYIDYEAVALDGAWYPPVYVHGAMAWNSRYPGWRTLFSPTVYGWHENVKVNAKYFLDSQVKDSPNTTAKVDPVMGLALQAGDIESEFRHTERARLIRENMIDTHWMKDKPPEMDLADISRKACLLARSRGGLMLYTWAESPESVACIAGIYPVCDFLSCPGIEVTSAAYGMTPDQLQAEITRHNPIDLAASLAKAKIPVFHIHGDSDLVVPLEQNSGEIKRIYDENGGDMKLVVPVGQGHNMWSGFFECQELVDFIITHAARGHDALTTTAKSDATGARIELDVNHLDRLMRANMRVAAKKASVDSDPLRPVFHIMPEAGTGGDPNGLIYAKGKYHVFFQHAPELEWGKPSEEWEEGQPGYSGTGWGHVSSVDGVYWEHDPIAIMPERGSYDPNLCASGCAVIADDGTPTIFYTAAEPQTQCIARSQDANLRWWLKDENNPIIHEPEIENFAKGGFRDPFIWREGTTWRMITCGALRGVGGMAVHSHSENLKDWVYAGPFASGMGEHCIAWECPNFIRFGDMGVLIVSPLFDNLQDTNHAPRGEVVYTIAPYTDGVDFSPREWRSLDIGGPNNIYAANTLKTPDGRWLLWGMNLGGGSPGHHWVTNLSLPRVITLRPDGLLGQEPPVELEGLRRAHWSEKNISLDGAHVLDVKSDTFEIIVEIELGGAQGIGLDTRASYDFAAANRIRFDAVNGVMYADGVKASFTLLDGEDVLRIHAFCDKSIVEVFVNRRECVTLRAFNDIENKSIRLYSEGGVAKIHSVDVWEIANIWERPDAPPPLNSTPGETPK